MLVRKKDRIEIWSEGWNEESNKISMVAISFMTIIWGFLAIGCLKKNVLVGLIVTIIPALMIFAGVKLYIEEKEKYLMIAVDKNYIEIYDAFNKKHQMIEKIALKQINKVWIRQYRNITGCDFYMDGNSKKKCSFRTTNKEWIKTALIEYKKDLEIKLT